MKKNKLTKQIADSLFFFTTIWKFHFSALDNCDCSKCSCKFGFKEKKRFVAIKDTDICAHYNKSEVHVHAINHVGDIVFLEKPSDQHGKAYFSTHLMASRRMYSLCADCFQENVFICVLMAYHAMMKSCQEYSFALCYLSCYKILQLLYASFFSSHNVTKYGLRSICFKTT